nr:transporter substrate-binding domain-containing protein [Pseudodesulfovibrio sp.]
MIRLAYAVFSLLLMANFACAEQVLVISVENKDWAGHYQWVKGELTGIDADIFRRVASELGYAIEFIPFPWKRATQMAEDSLTDGVFDLASTTRRGSVLHFVDTPLSQETIVFWVKPDSDFSYQGRFSKSLRLGIMHGEDWSRWFEESGTPIVTSFTSFGAAFSSLEAGRIDVFANYLTSTRELINKHGFEEEIVPSLPIIPNYYYVALSRKPGHRALSKKLSKALAKFFDSPAYADLLKTYGVKNPDNAFHPSRSLNQ